DHDERLREHHVDGRGVVGGLPRVGGARSAGSWNMNVTTVTDATPVTTSFATIEFAAAAIVVAWVFMRLRRETEKRAFVVKLASVAIAAFIGEETCIRLYGFYGYSPSWHAFLDRVPLAIVCIWP